ncbi:MAG: cytochrome c-type biogenesis protein [Pseudomonadota bacterium]|nr:cytochrome c-type biogenesis protein [Pseudomonadota bacterium]
MNIFSFSIIFIVLIATVSMAIEPDEVLTDKNLEKRARIISSEIRCLVCRNESIDESNAELARDLRLIIRERLLLGESDDDIFDFLEHRYGEFVLLRPQFSGSGLILWVSLPVCFLLGLLFVSFHIRNNSLNLSDEEQNVQVHNLDTKFSKSEKAKVNTFFKS